MARTLPAIAEPAAAPSITVAEIQVIGNAIAKSGLFGIKTAEQAVALCLIAHAEGRHPALAARDYSIIQGRPAKNAEAMLRDFIESGGKVEWHKLDDTIADATFSHPSGGSARISWDMRRAITANLAGKDNWKKYPRQMLRSRVVSEGVRTVCPMATSGMYVPEEVADFEPRREPRREPRDVTPRSDQTKIEQIDTQAEGAREAAEREARALPPHDPETGEIYEPEPPRATKANPAVRQGDLAGVSAAREAYKKVRDAIDGAETAADLKAMYDAFLDEWNPPWDAEIMAIAQAGQPHQSLVDRYSARFSDLIREIPA